MSCLRRQDLTCVILFAFMGQQFVRSYSLISEAAIRRIDNQYSTSTGVLQLTSLRLDNLITPFLLSPLRVIHQSRAWPIKHEGSCTLSVERPS